MGESGKMIAAAVVVTVTVADETVAPFNAREPGETLQVDRAGAPVQVNVTI